MLVFYFYLIIGILLVTLEMLTTTLYLLIIGVSCVIASIIGYFLHDWLIATACASGLSIMGCALIAKYKTKNGRIGKSLVNHIGQTVEVVEIKSDSLLVQYSGSYWNAKVRKINEIKIGDKLVIIKFSHNALEVE